MSAPLLKLDSITKTFGAVRALKGVSFELRAGEVHALLGENGAGKSTLIKVITGAHTPDAGSMELAGEPVRHLTPARAHELGIACVYQQPALFADLTVAENIALRLESVSPFHRVDWRGRNESARALLARMGARIEPTTEVRALSMPEQQLVEIACVLGAGARIVIMDEPTASLTRQEQDLLFAVVRDLRRSGVGIVYISHRLEEIFALADRVTVLRDGESVGTRQVPPHAASAEQGAAAGLTRSELIGMMVGRDVSQEFPPPGRRAGDPVLSLRGVSCRRGGVHSVSLQVCAGEIVGVAGLVGAGRTELARVLFGLTPADEGEIRLGGEVVCLGSPAEAIRRGIAYVPEDRRRHGVILDLPIAHNVTMAVHPRLFRGGWLRPADERAMTEHFVRELGIKASGPEAPGASLSGGNQQKVSLARWLATRPKLLILDEPTQGVDVGAKGEIHRIIRQLAEAGLAVLMISSDLPEVLGMSDRIVVMRGGTVVAELPAGSEAAAVMAAALGHTAAEVKA
ncbi:MAG: sugar ABC transporter ATP-binding protein [Verrucomicrobiales bacterium]|nr:sugar ABC transporter ATP-binding protein [Verrucomicrobiales bacterium]